MDENRSRTKSLWARLLCVLVTSIALWLVWRNLDHQAFMATLRQMRPAWFAGSVFCFGVALAASAWRWHLMLRLTGTVVHLGATIRFTLIGHFLYVVLFGVAGGDVGKSVLYARYHRWQVSKVLASAPLDRLLGFGGALIFAFLALGTALFAGAFGKSRDWLNLPALKWILLFIAVAALGGMALLRWRPGGSGGIATLLRTFVDAGLKLVRNRSVAAQGLFCGWMVQLCMSAVLALSLQAVASDPVPWFRLLWVFPIVTAVSGVPVTVAGLGVREAAALTLLGWYGVPAAEAVTASLLTLAAGLVWMAVGGWLLWREDRHQQPHRRLPESISVVIPARNEAASITATVRAARAVPEVKEVIVVDGESSDDTVRLARELGCRTLESPAGRGSQLRLGAAEATGDVVVLLHADTELPPHAGRALLNCLRDSTVVGGGFWKIFKEPRFLMLGSRWKCVVRLFLGRRVVGDQAMFCLREALTQAGGVPDIPLMEEFELCRRLRKTGRLALADATVVTSGRRFREHGVLRTYCRMAWVLIRYYLGASPEKLRRLYESK
jgi:rSAM/selenodomain-associated transferase 2